MVIPFQCLFCVPLDGCYPPETFLDEMSSRTRTAHSRASEKFRGSTVSFPFWASLLSCVGLFIVTMGPSHLRLLARFDEQLIMGASLRLVRLRLTGGPLSFLLHGLMTSSYRGESTVCLPSGRRGIAPLVRSSVIKLLCHTSPVFPRFRVNGSHLFQPWANPYPWHFLNLRPLPHGQGSLRPALAKRRCNSASSWASRDMMVAGGLPARSSAAISRIGRSIWVKNAL